MSQDIPTHELPDGNDLRVAVVAARFNPEKMEALTRRVVACLEAAGAATDLIRVPGSWELPLAAQIAAQTGKFDAVVALGVVVAGDTRHHEHIADATGWGIQEVALKTRIPVINGILVTETEEQARARTMGDVDKGFHFAVAALEMGRLLQTFQPPATGPS